MGLISAEQFSILTEPFAEILVKLGTTKTKEKK